MTYRTIIKEDENGDCFVELPDALLAQFPGVVSWTITRRDDGALVLTPVTETEEGSDAPTTP